MTENAERNKTKQHLFEEEVQVLRQSQQFLLRDELTLEQCKEQIAALNTHYEDLVDQSKLITKVSDRLQKKINNTNEALEDANAKLQESLDALTKAKVGRKTATIVLVVFVVLFLFSEAFLEPQIEDYARLHFEGEFAVMGFSLGSKAILALLLRPVESIVQKILMNQAKKESERNNANA